MTEGNRNEWQEDERKLIDAFFREKVPQALKQDGKPENACDEGACTEFAKQLLSADDLAPVDNQGCNSFTLICHSRGQIVQFRLRPLDTSIIDLAHQTYGDIIPRSTFHSGFALPVYSSRIIPGRVHFLQPFPKAHFPLKRQQTTVKELGWFIGRATHHIQPKCAYKADSWTVKARENLQRLEHNTSLTELAPDLRKAILRIQDKVQLLDSLPAVLTHHDLAEVNIFVNDEGNVTGVIDLDTAGVEAFGMSIWGIYVCFLGSMENEKWSFHNQLADGYDGQTVREVLEATFWDSLWSSISLRLKREDLEEAVKIALAVGIINRYFVRGMLDQIDPADKVHCLSFEYAKGILPTVI